jgi:tRNA-dihydrouridine synthase
MGEPVALGHACGLCGGQISLTVQTDGGTYTHDLAALLQATRDDTLLIETNCGCPSPRRVALEGTRLSSDTLDGDE